MSCTIRDYTIRGINSDDRNCKTDAISTQQISVSILMNVLQCIVITLNLCRIKIFSFFFTQVYNLLNSLIDFPPFRWTSDHFLSLRMFYCHSSFNMLITLYFSRGRPVSYVILPFSTYYFFSSLFNIFISDT